MSAATTAEKNAPPFSRTVFGQSVCAGLSGVFQVYSGGIAIDTISTRMQAGMDWREALFGRAKSASLGAMLRNNLYAGHLVMAQGRFPYLFINLNAYAQAERLVYSRDAPPGGAASGAAAAPPAAGVRPARRAKTLVEELFCIACSTLLGAAMITIIECPKILAQLAPREPGAPAPRAPTITSVVREHGFGRLLRGYDACVCREALFNCALLGSPGLARRARDAVAARERVEHPRDARGEERAVARVLHAVGDHRARQRARRRRAGVERVRARPVERFGERSGRARR